MVTEHFLEAMEIRSYVEGIKKKAKAASRKATNQKKKLKMQELLKAMNEEIEYFQSLVKVCCL